MPTKVQGKHLPNVPIRCLPYKKRNKNTNDLFTAFTTNEQKVLNQIFVFLVIIFIKVYIIITQHHVLFCGIYILLNYNLIFN